MENTLSVIIPAYNVEDTLRRCVDSVLQQDVAGMEIIIVDDGSTDGTGALCDKLAGITSCERQTGGRNIVVVHQKNAGLSEARNTGLRLASGELITFVDSDDYLEPGTYPKLMQMMDRHPEYDFIEFSVRKEDGQKVLLRLDLPDRVYTDMNEYWIDGKAYSHTYAWNKIYRQRLFDDIRFPRGKKFEDVFTMGELLRRTKTVRTTSAGLYHYIYNSKGITAMADGNDLLDLLTANINILRHNPQLRSRKRFADYYAHVLNIQLSTYEFTGREETILLPTLPYYNSWKLLLLHVFGMRHLCHLERIIKKAIDLLCGLKYNS